jgi:hypothetical protein
MVIIKYCTLISDFSGFPRFFNISGFTIKQKVWSVKIEITLNIEAFVTKTKQIAKCKIHLRAPANAMREGKGTAARFLSAKATHIY